MDVRQTLEPGLSDRYRIDREIGAGGMATVYLAHDLRHDRQVALKVLRPELGAVLGVERFLTEIRVTANLQHPHLLPLFDSGEVAGLLFYVMPYVAGESLRQRVEREQQLGIDETVRIATAVASALDYAHRRQVVHRDLKPENILMHEGEPVVSDFGIALAVSNAGGARITQTGLSLGTPAYMSPEQAAGDRVVDARSDVYSLGAVVYELLIGEPPHTGINVQQVISRVLTEQPRGISDQRPTVPRWLNDAIMRSLAKLPADRFASAREFGDALKDGAARQGTGATVVSTETRSARVPRQWVPWGVAAVFALLGLRPLLRRHAEPAPDTLVRFAITPPGGVRSAFSDLAISADGRRIVASEGPPGSRRVWLRELSDDELVELTPLTGTQAHFLSPDGSAVGFVSQSRIRVMAISGGPMTTLAAVADGPFADPPAWGSHGDIVFGGGEMPGLWTVPASGGTPRRLTTPPEGSMDSSPGFLPSGEQFFFERRASSQAVPTIMRGALTGDARAVGDVRGYAPRYVAGYLTYLTGEGELNAVSLSANGEPQGAPVVMLGPLRTATGPRGAPLRTATGPRGVPYAASHNGVVAFIESARRQSAIVRVTRDGSERPIPGIQRAFGAPATTPRGDRIAIEVSSEDGSTDIYTYDEAGASQRITRGGRNQSPVWNAAGTAIAWGGGSVDGEGQLMLQRFDVPDSARQVLRIQGLIRPQGFSSRGDSVRAVILAPRAMPQLVTISLSTGGMTPVHYEAGERMAHVSPDGRWIAYTGTEGGVLQVYVRPANASGPVLQVSTAGGEHPRWGRDGGRLFYRDGQRMNEVVLGSEPTPRVVRRAMLFADRYERVGITSYDVTTSGDFVMLQGDSTGQHIDVLVNATVLARRSAVLQPAKRE